MGVTGVYHRKTKSGMDRYIVKIGIKKKVIHIGTFDTLEKAVEARLEAEKNIINLISTNIEQINTRNRQVNFT